MSSVSLYQRVVGVTSGYIGSSADRFIASGIVNHLGKAPEKLQSRDLLVLSKWLKPAIAMIIDDKQLVDQYVNNLSSLSNNSRKL